VTENAGNPRRRQACEEESVRRLRDPLLLVVVAFTAYAAAVAVLGWSRIGDTPIALAAAIEGRPSLLAPAGSGEVHIEIPEGASVERIVEALVQAGVVQDRETLWTLLGYTGVAPELQAGRYDFLLNTPPAEVLRVLRIGPDRVERFVFRAGLRVQEIGEILEEHGILTSAEWSAAVQDLLADPAARARWPFLDEQPGGVDLLGYLLPESYEVSRETTASSLLAAMLDRFAELVLPLMPDAELQGMSLYDVLTLASIVEREGVHPEEKPFIAAAFRNRLDVGMPLQADPTVQFAITLGEAGAGVVAQYGWWKAGLTEVDLVYDSPYNTYLYPALPPGPIANPDLDSIMATISPAPVDYYYFVAHPACDGRHLFAETLDEHIANVERFRASGCGEDD
jgi:UPF0755 protein